MAAALIAAAAVAVPADAALAEPGPSFTVVVVRDLDADGLHTPSREGGVGGIQVEVTPAYGHQGVYTTGPDGTFEVPLSASPTRQFQLRLLVDAGRPDGLQPAFAGEELASRLAYVEAGPRTVVKFGVWRPGDFCSVVSDLTTPCQVAMNKPGDLRTIVAFNNTWRGDHFGLAPDDQAPTTLATRDETGTLYGMAYSRERRVIYSGAYAKRYTTYGPAGPGGIYLTPRDGAPGQTTVFATLPAGDTPHSDVRADSEFIRAVGREGLGDLELSADGTELYAVNLFDRRLYTFDATQTAVDAPLSIVDIPNPGCVSVDDWRPMGLGVRDGLLYVGGVCSAESTQNPADLRAVVWTYDTVTRVFGAYPVLDHNLVYDRGHVFGRANPGEWHPWTSGDPVLFPDGPGGAWGRPEPMLSDIEIESDGNMVLGFRDRFADLTGYQLINPNPLQDDVNITASGGDIIRACRVAPDAFAWEGTVDGCRTHGAQGHREFFAGDFYGHRHLETAQGAIALSYTDDEIVSTHLDAAYSYDSGGVGWYHRDTGRRHPGVDGYAFQRIDSALDGGFGNANGLGDLELLCNDPPIEIGNRVWFDSSPGAQHAAETDGVPGVVVTLLDEAGTVIAETVTNFRGEYTFSSEDYPGITPFTRYFLRFDRSVADYAGLELNYPDGSQIRWTEDMPVEAWGIQGISAETNSDTVPDDGIAGSTATAEVTTGDWGSVHHDIDAGLTEQA